MKTQLLSLFLAVWSTRAFGAPQAPDYFPPAGDWRTAAGAVHIARHDELKAFEDYAFPADLPGRKGIRTDSVIIVRDGWIIYERYGRGYDAHAPHQSWSVSKSFTNALVGVAVQDGKLKLSDSVCNYVKGLPADHCALQVGHLLRWTSGLDWKEEYEKSTAPTESSILEMLYGKGHADMASFTLGHGFAHPPGEHWSYSTGDSTALQAMIRGAYGPDAYAGLPWKEFFSPLGMDKVVWQSDSTGLRVGGAYVYATPLDFARFGYLYLKDGVWNGKRILPEGWVKESTTVTPAFAHAPPSDEKSVPGAQLWLNRPVPERGMKSRWPSLPEDAFYADGHWGQYIFVIPSLQLVIVRTGDDRDERALDLNRFLTLALQVAKP